MRASISGVSRPQATSSIGRRENCLRDPDCKLCALHKTAQFVCLLGAGPKPNDVMIIGEAPGEREDDSGTPFVGASGRLLMDMLAGVGLSRADAYITNAV